jgi:FkbM family methyltransferase
METKDERIPASEVPILIISYNNYKYVENTVNQILTINSDYFKNILIIDNCSTDIDTINYLKTVNCKVHFNTKNEGPWVNSNHNKHIYEQMPDKFILTDPDLQFNTNLPKNYIEILVYLMEKHNLSKIGFAIDISDFDKMYQDKYFANKNIYEWESEFWETKIDDDEYELYKAPIDTTFALINNRFSYGFARIAGNFTAKHLPWYIDNTVFNVYENFMLQQKTSGISTSKGIILRNILNKNLKIIKNNEVFFIKKDINNHNLHFWEKIFSWWEGDTFVVFDKYLDKNKVFVDIGGWIGTTCMYASRKSKHVYCVEADNKSFNDMELNCKLNCENNYTLINNAIYNIDNCNVKFGRNIFRGGSKMNDSTSHIYSDNVTSNEFYTIKTITISSIIKTFNIEPSNISLIKIDIEGGEEYILDELYHIYTEYKVPLLISFHVDWWKNKNLDRFKILTQDHKEQIKNNRFISLVFDFNLTS